MKRLILGLLLLFSVMSFSQRLKDLDDKNGFRDDLFGTPVESFQNLALIQESKDGYNKVYTKTDEDFSVGNIEIFEVWYFFYKGRLETIGFKTKGYTNSDGILDILKANYGNGSQANRHIEEYFWHGKTIRLHYDENSLSNDAQVFMSTNVYEAEKEKDQQESIKKAKI